jgi:hypothetical protein
MKAMPHTIFVDINEGHASHDCQDINEGHASHNCQDINESHASHDLCPHISNLSNFIIIKLFHSRYLMGKSSNGEMGLKFIYGIHS